MKRPNARATIKNADVALRHILREWELAYRKNASTVASCSPELQRHGDKTLIEIEPRICALLYAYRI
jgi:hypothetical protein